jgi:preprotein translocase subunit SecA
MATRRPPASAAFDAMRRAQPPAPAQAPAQPAPAIPPKVDRNDPCPCGSGKKYKKCHGAGM